MLALLRLGSAVSVIPGSQKDGALAVKNADGEQEGLVMTKDAVSAGTARFCFVVKKGLRSTIGVCNPAISWSTCVNETEHGWGLCVSSGQLGHSGPANAPYLTLAQKTIKEGDEVAVEVNCEAATITFFVNGESCGIAFSKVPCRHPFHGAVSLVGAGDVVEYSGLQWIDVPPVIATSPLGSTSKPRVPRTLPRAPTARPPPRKGRNASSGLPGFSLSLHGGDIRLSGNDNTVAECIATKPGWSRKTALSEFGISSGSATWHFEIASPNSTHITIGILTEEAAKRNRDGDFLNSNTQKGWGFYQRNGCIGHCGPAATQYGRTYGQFDRISVHIDCSSRTLSFLLNDESLGPAFADLPSGKFHAAVSLRDPGDKVRLVKVESHTQSRPAAAVGPGSVPSVTSVALYWKNPSIVQLPFVTESVPSVVDCKDGHHGRNGTRLRWRKQVPIGLKPSWREGLMLIRPLLQAGMNNGGPQCAGDFDADGDWRPGLQRWTFRIVAGSKATIGVCTAFVDKHSFVNQTKEGWGLFQYSGMVGHNGPAKTDYYNKRIDPGSVVTVEADRKQRTLSYIVNGQRLGVAYSNLPDQTQVLYGAVSLYDDKAEIELLVPEIPAAAEQDAREAEHQLTRFLRELDDSCRLYDNLSLEMFKTCQFSDVKVGPKIGRGCSGEIYQVTCSKDVAGRVFAMKKLFDYAAKSDQQAIKHQREKFLMDFRVPASLRSSDEALSHVVKCYTHLHAPTINATEVEKSLGRGKTEYIIMEYCKQSLETYLEEFYAAHGRCPGEQTLLLCVLQILHALAVLEERHIVHRDLKLDNIMVKSSSDLELRLIDFGEALVDGEGDRAGGNAMNMAPEVLAVLASASDEPSPNRRGSLDAESRQARFDLFAKADIWALGCLLYQMLRQPHPFKLANGMDRTTPRPGGPNPVPPRPPLLPSRYPRMDKLADPSRRPSARQAVHLVGNLIWFPEVAPIPSPAFSFATAPLNEELHLPLVRAVRWGAQKFVKDLVAHGQFQVVHVRCIAEKLKAQYLVDSLRRFASVKDQTPDPSKPN